MDTKIKIQQWAILILPGHPVQVETRRRTTILPLPRQARPVVLLEPLQVRPTEGQRTLQDQRRHRLRRRRRSSTRDDLERHRQGKRRTHRDVRRGEGRQWRRGVDRVLCNFRTGARRTLVLRFPFTAVLDRAVSDYCYLFFL